MPARAVLERALLATSATAACPRWPISTMAMRLRVVSDDERLASKIAAVAFALEWL